MKKELIATLRDPQFVDEAIGFAVERNPALLKVDPRKVARLAKSAAVKIAYFEELALNSLPGIPFTPDEARKIKVILTVSGTGTILKPHQDDRWKDIPWAGGTDRARLYYTDALVRSLTEKITGNSYDASQLEELRADIYRFGPFVMYGSTKEQNDHFEEALREHNLTMLRSNVFINRAVEVNTNTADQMETLVLPPGLEIEAGDRIGVVTHAPHMIRVLGMMERYKPLPEGLIPVPYPLSSPDSAGTDYAKLEISGLLYYTFITEDSSSKPHPYQIKF